MDIGRWAETTDILNDALETKGCEEATLEALVRCFGAPDRNALAADLQAVSHFYPALLVDEAKPLIRLMFNIASLAVAFSEPNAKSLERSVEVYADDRITEAWVASPWRVADGSR